MTLNKIYLAIALVLTLAISGCVSSGASSYGAAISVSTSSRDKAAIDARQSSATVTLLKKDLKQYSRSQSRAERRLKRLGKRKAVKQRHRLANTITTNQDKTKSAEKELAKAERNSQRAEKKLERAKRKVVLAEKRKVDYDKRQVRLAKARLENQGNNSRSLFAFARTGDINYSDYKARTDGGFKLPAVPTRKMDKKFLRQRVDYQTNEKPGTLIVETEKRFVYLIEGNGKAMRYGIGVGRAGFDWQGTARMAWKREWPTWTPPQSMIRRRPELAKYGGPNGMKGGPANPLGARALYIYKNGKDTLYRLHGTPEWASIGTAVSSGCIRLINQDIIDLYSRVPNGAKIVVKQG